jgi:GT2 family glycosyltransferase
VKVTALLVTHDGATWLPAVLSALAASTVAPSRIVAVDTGSSDESAQLVADSTGSEPVRLDERTGFPAAVHTGLAACDPAEPDEWVWLLHDDAAPATNCLEALVHAAASAPPDVAAVGPKLREWPSLRRLLEVGVTISPTGRRVTGLEPGEYDQGQHDEVADVLAVNTAGMLVRRTVLEQLGLDDRLPLFGNDIDFGWRAARAGHRILVAPAAVMFHVEAAHRGRRHGPLAGRPRRGERAAAVRTLLVNGRAATLPLRMARLLLGGLLRAVGLLLVRAPGEARDELLGLLRVYSRPDALLRGRRARRATAVRSHREVAALLAPFWLPYRQGLDFVTDVGVAIGHSWRDRARRRAPDAGVTTSLLRSPAAWLLAGTVVLSLVAGRRLLGGAPLHGGALLPAPAGIGAWWGSWWSSWHWTGAGTDVPAPAWVLPLAAVATVLLGHPGWVVDLVFVLCVPLCAIGAHRLLRRLVRSEWPPVWGALAYALVPVLCGGVGQGRLGTVAGAVVLPWVVRSALGLGAPGGERRWRAAWRTALGVGLLTAFVPAAWLLTLLLVVLAPLLGARRAGPARLLVVAVVPLLLVAPWAIVTLTSPGAWLVEAGRAGSVPVLPGGLDLLLGRGTGPGSAPPWLSVGLPLAAAVALLRGDTRPRVVRAWLGALAAAALLVLTSRVLVDLPGVPFEFRAWPGFLVVVVQGCFVLAAVIASDGLLEVISTERFGWRQPLAGLAFVVGVLGVLAGTGWWVVAGTPGPLTRHGGDGVPTYMAELAADRDTGAVLVLTGDRHRIEYQLLRHGSLRLGDEGVLAMTPPDDRLTAVVTRLLSADPGSAAGEVARYGTSYVYAPAPAPAVVSAALDAAPGLAPASAPRHDTRAWQLKPAPRLTAVRPDPGPWHLPLVALQLFVLVAAVVLAAPGRRQPR